MLLLVPLDESDTSTATLPILAERFDHATNEIQLFAVLDPGEKLRVPSLKSAQGVHEPYAPETDITMTQYGPAIAAGGQPSASLEAKRQALANVEAQRERALTELGVSNFHTARVTVQTIRSAKVAEAIVAHAKAINADVVAMATHARGPVGRLILGSVAETVLRKSPVPVLLVPPGAQRRAEHSS